MSQLCLHSILQLFEHYITMLSSAGVFESTFHSATDLELGQSVMRILLAAITQPDKEVSIHTYSGALVIRITNLNHDTFCLLKYVKLLFKP